MLDGYGLGISRFSHVSVPLSTFSGRTTAINLRQSLAAKSFSSETGLSREQETLQYELSFTLFSANKC